MESVENPLSYFDDNLHSLTNVLMYCKAYNIKYIMYSSSAAVYGLTTNVPFDEVTPLHESLSPYAYAKIVGENILRDYIQSTKDAKGISLRHFTTIGADKSGLLGEHITDTTDTVMASICKAAKTDKPFTITVAITQPRMAPACVIMCMFLMLQRRMYSHLIT